MAESTVAAPVDRERFSLHPEDWMTERPSHRQQVAYLEHAIQRVRPELFVAGNLGVYWVPGELEHPYAGPDVLVSRHHPPREDPPAYLTYEDGPLTLVVEVASPKTRAADRKKRDVTYAQELRVPEHLWIDLPRRVLELRQLVGDRYELLEPNARGQLWSPELGIGFAWQADRRFVRVVAPDGTLVPTAQEEAEQEARRAEQEARRAEQEARRADQEAERRAAAEQKAEALAAELERLRRTLSERPDSPE